MKHKRVTLFAGHYGSGKTNIAVNYALLLAREGKRAAIADLDIVNPYFRTKDSAAELAAGWRLTLSISHTGDTAVAFAVAWREEAEG